MSRARAFGGCNRLHVLTQIACRFLFTALNVASSLSARTGSRCSRRISGGMSRNDARSVSDLG